MLVKSLVSVLLYSRSSGFRGEAGRVIAHREVSLPGGWIMSDSMVIGGGIGAAAGAAAGAAVMQTVVGAVICGLLGVVGGAIAAGLIGRPGKGGVEVTVHKDNGQYITIAQVDDGSIHTGDRVVILYDNKNAAKVVRDTGRPR